MQIVLGKSYLELRAEAGRATPADRDRALALAAEQSLQRDEAQAWAALTN